MRTKAWMTARAQPVTKKTMKLRKRTSIGTMIKSRKMKHTLYLSTVTEGLSARVNRPFTVMVNVPMPSSS